MKFLFPIILVLIFSFSAVCAQESISVPDRLIASTFKNLAKGYVATVNLEKIKKDQITRLHRVNDEKFKKHFKKASLVLNSLPSELKIKYGFRDSLTKEDVIEKIAELDKEDINQIIDAIPETFIIFQFRQYWTGLGKDIRQSNAVQKIYEFWDRVIPQVNEKSESESEWKVNLIDKRI